jgi:hypothetical protein
MTFPLSILLRGLNDILESELFSFSCPAAQRLLQSERARQQESDQRWHDLVQHSAVRDYLPLNHVRRESDPLSALRHEQMIEVSRLQWKSFCYIALRIIRHHGLSVEPIRRQLFLALDKFIVRTEGMH